MKLSQLTWITAILITGAAQISAQAADCNCLPGVTLIRVVEPEPGELAKSCIMTQCPRGPVHIKVVDGKIVSYQDSNIEENNCTPVMDDFGRPLSGIQRVFEYREERAACKHALNNYNSAKSK